jgi:hypothetical protein
LSDQIGGRKVGQHHRGDQHGTDDGLRAVQSEVASGANKGQKDRSDAFEGKLKQLNDAGNGGPYAEGDQLRSDGNPTVTKQAESKRQVHGLKPAWFSKKDKVTARRQSPCDASGLVRTFLLVWCAHVMAVCAIVIGPSVWEAAQFEVGVTVNGLEVELVKPRYEGFSLCVRRHQDW